MRLVFGVVVDAFGEAVDGCRGHASLAKHVGPRASKPRALRVPRLDRAVQRGAARVPRRGRPDVFELYVVVAAAKIVVGAEPEPDPRRVGFVERSEPHRASQRPVREKLRQRVEGERRGERHASRRSPGVHRRQRRLPVLTKRRRRLGELAPELRAVELRETRAVDDVPRVDDLRAHGEKAGASDALDAVRLEQRPPLGLHLARSVRRARHADGGDAGEHRHQRGELEVLQHVLLFLLLLGVVAAVAASAQGFIRRRFIVVARLVFPIRPFRCFVVLVRDVPGGQGVHFHVTPRGDEGSQRLVVRVTDVYLAPVGSHE